MANILTFFRIFISLIIPVSFWLIFKYINNQEREIYILFILVLFIFASLSDFFDGFIARKYNQESLLGKVLDPIADKLLVIISMLVLMISYWENSLIFFSVILIIFREILISGLREFLAKRKELNLPVSSLSKFKTFIQMFSIAILLTGETGNKIVSFQDYNAQTIGIILLWIAAFLTLYTGYDYLRKGIVTAINDDEK